MNEILFAKGRFLLDGILKRVERKNFIYIYDMWNSSIYKTWYNQIVHLYGQLCLTIYKIEYYRVLSFFESLITCQCKQVLINVQIKIHI